MLTPQPSCPLPRAPLQLSPFVLSAFVQTPLFIFSLAVSSLHLDKVLGNAGLVPLLPALPPRTPLPPPAATAVHVGRRCSVSELFSAWGRCGCYAPVTQRGCSGMLNKAPEFAPSHTGSALLNWPASKPTSSGSKAKTLGMDSGAIPFSLFCIYVTQSPHLQNGHSNSFFFFFLKGRRGEWGESGKELKTLLCTRQASLAECVCGGGGRGVHITGQNRLGKLVPPAPFQQPKPCA